MGTYVIQFRYADTGLTPSFTKYVKVSDLSSAGSSPTFTEVGHGMYKFDATPTYDIAFTIDGGSGIADSEIRYVRGVLSPQDAYLDAAMSTRAAIADYTSLRAGKLDNLDNLDVASSTLATASALSTLSTTVGTLSTTVGGIVTSVATLATSAALSAVSTIATSARDYALRASGLLDGRKKINTVTNKLTIYESDNTTPLQIWSLKDATGAPTSSKIYESVRDPMVVLTHSLHVEYNGSNRTGATFTDHAEWDGLTKFSGVCWIRNNGTGTQWFLGKPASAGVSFRLGFVTTGTDIAFVTSAGTLSLTDNLFTTSAWHQLVWSYDGTQATTNSRFRAWCDGVEFTTKSGSCATSIASGSDLLTIGGNGSGTSNPDYDICHVALWLGSLIDTTVAAEIWGGGVPSDYRYTSKGSPTHYYQLQNDLTDSGSNVINGTGLNSPAFTSAVPG